MIDKRTAIELIGAISVVASLVFVGLEIQQGTLATRSATNLQLKDGWVQLNLASATSRDLAAALMLVEETGWEDADYVSKSLVAGIYRTLFHMWSNAHFQYTNGVLDESQWMPIRREIVANSMNPLARQVWKDWNHVYEDDFRNLVDEIVIDGAAQTRESNERSGT